MRVLGSAVVTIADDSLAQMLDPEYSYSGQTAPPNLREGGGGEGFGLWKQKTIPNGRTTPPTLQPRWGNDPANPLSPSLRISDKPIFDP